MAVHATRPQGDVMHSVPLLDCAGRRRSPATLARFHRDRPPRNKGLRQPPDPSTVEEIIAVLRAAGDRPDGVRLRGVIVLLWGAGLRITEAPSLQESDLDQITKRQSAACLAFRATRDAR
jgi:integrase